ncbi:hypothetical protein EV368DRAFT_90095 [Lentinula lateritia]|nr:hypothetical protein EV368DRAFT_90095 [Lentinula lateritia]
MASSSSQTRTGASSTPLPTSLAEAQELIAGLKSKSSQPLFFESDLFQRLSEGDYSPPILNSQNLPDHDSSKPFPAFSYPSALVPFCFPPGSSHSLDSGEAYNAFEEAAPCLINCSRLIFTIFGLDEPTVPCLPSMYSRQLMVYISTSLLSFKTVSSNNGVFPLIIDHPFWRGPSDIKHFPVIPIPFCLRFREGSAMMRLASPKDLDPFVSLCSSMTETRPLPGGPRVPSPIEDSLESSEEDQSVAPPKRNKRKRELASLMANASTIQDRPVLPKASSSKKKVERPVPKPQATAWSKTTVKVVEESRVSPESEELATPSFQIKCVRLPPRLRQAAKGKARQMEVPDIKETETEEEVVPPPSKRRKSSKSAPAPHKASNFRPALLIDDQGRLKLPGDSVEGFTPFKRIEHARNSAPLQCQNPIFDVNPEFLDLGVILTTQKTSFTMQDLLQINRTIRDGSNVSHAPLGASSACVR